MKIGIDVGGSHICLGLIDENGNVLLKKEKDIIVEDKNNILQILTNYIKTCINDIERTNKNIDSIGIAFPGRLANGKMKKSCKLGISGEELKENLQKYFQIPIYVKNDAKCAALCEKEYGSLKEYKNCIFMTIGTGIGGALFIDDELVTISQNDLMEVGHMIIQKDGRQCDCGKKGCFEQYASIKALKRDIIEEFSMSNDITGKELYDFLLENKKETRVNKIIDEYIENLSIGLCNLITLLKPEAISLGGSFAYYEDILFDKLKIKLEEELKNEICPQLVLATKKNDAGIIGATKIKN